MKILKELIQKQNQKKTLAQEQKAILDKFSKIELLMLCDRLIDETDQDKSVEDILGLTFTAESQIQNLFNLEITAEEETVTLISEMEAEEIRKLIMEAVDEIPQHVIEAVEELSHTIPELEEETPPIFAADTEKDSEEIEATEDAVATPDIESLILQQFSNQGFVLSEIINGTDNDKLWFEFNLKLSSLDEEKSLWAAIRILKETSDMNLEVVHKAKKGDKLKRKIRVELPLENQNTTDRKREDLLA